MEKNATREKSSRPRDLLITPHFYFSQMNIAHLLIFVFWQTAFASLDSRWDSLNENLLDMYDKLGRFDEDFTKIIESKGYATEDLEDELGIELHVGYAFKSYLAWYRYLLRDLATKTLGMQKARKHLEPKTQKRCNFILGKMSKTIEDVEIVLVHDHRRTGPALLARLKIWFSDYRKVLDSNRDALFQTLNLKTPPGIWDEIGNSHLYIPGLY